MITAIVTLFFSFCCRPPQTIDRSESVNGLCGLMRLKLCYMVDGTRASAVEDHFLLARNSGTSLDHALMQTVAIKIKPVAASARRTVRTLSRHDRKIDLAGQRGPA